MENLTLELDAQGNLLASLNGVVFFKTKGNPSKGNVPFSSLEEATAVFEDIFPPVVDEPVAAPTVDPAADPSA